MLKQMRLKKQLGDGYFYEQRLSPAVVKNLLEILDGGSTFLVAASLTAASSTHIKEVKFCHICNIPKVIK